MEQPVKDRQRSIRSNHESAVVIVKKATPKKITRLPEDALSQATYEIQKLTSRVLAHIQK